MDDKTDLKFVDVGEGSSDNMMKNMQNALLQKCKSSTEFLARVLGLAQEAADRNII